MSDKNLSLLGLMRRASAIEIGEENAGSAVRGGKAKLLLLASDASENAVKRAEGFAYGRNVLTVQLPYTKAEISAAVGLAGCSMAAVTDLGFANSLMGSLAAEMPEKYGELAAETAKRFEKAARRKKTAEAGGRNKRNGKRRTSV